MGGSWEGLGEVLGSILASKTGPQRAAMSIATSNVIFKGFWEGLGRVLGGFGEGFGRVLEGSGSFLGALGTSRRCFSSFLLFFRCLVAFLLFFLLFLLNFCLFRVFFAFAAFGLC